MVLTIILIVVSALEALTSYFFIGFWNHWMYLIFCWEPFLAFPLLYLINFGIVLAIAFIFGLFINVKKPVKKPSKFYRFLVTQVVGQVNFLARIHLKKSGFEKIDHSKPLTYVYNHTSRFDPMLIMDKCHKDNIICVTKPENKKIPIAGPFIHKAGYISVNRENTAEGIKAIEKGVEYIRDYGCSICISPEGRRSLNGRLLPFRAGAFNVALMGQTDIVVVGFKDTNRIHKNFPLKPTKVSMDILEVLPYDKISHMTTREISDYIHKLYEDYLG